MRSGAFVLVLGVSVALWSGCRNERLETLDLQGSQVQINNDTADNWNNVELWLNQYFRATVSAIPAHSRYKVPLSSFVSGYAQRFDFGHMQLTSLRMTAKKPDGTIIEFNKALEKGGLAGVADALGRKP